MVTFLSCPTSNPSACELAATIMLSLSLLPEAPNTAADENWLAPLVKVCAYVCLCVCLCVRVQVGGGGKEKLYQPTSCCEQSFKVVLAFW